MRKKRWALLLVPLIAGAWWLSRVPPPESPTPAGKVVALVARDEILIGEVGSLTGPEAEFGISTRNGIELAMAQANARGGVKGRPLTLRVYDDQSLPDGAARATRRLVGDRVSLIIGEAASASSLAMAPIAQDAGVPMLTPASTNPAVTAQGDYVFRACFSDTFQGLVMARYAYRTLKLRRIAVMVEAPSAYSEGLGLEFTRHFTELGGEIIGSATYRKGDDDFRAQLSSLASHRPEALYLPGYVREVVVIARQARELGLTVPFLGGDAWDSEKLFETGAGWIEGSFLTNHYAADDPAARDFVIAYQQAFGVVPDARAALGYDAVRLALDAMARAPDLSGPALRTALAQTKDFVGVTGTLSIDARRDAVKPAVVLSVQQGTFRFVERVQP